MQLIENKGITVATRKSKWIGNREMLRGLLHTVFVVKIEAPLESVMKARFPVIPC